ncbi:---NA--- [Paramuricea clavata]|uniref:---NA n=1 Tax=Paramuricea clavata TaxID=317549 RepID=A0A6S7G2J0_PARCT|nr:---NA--- [Paramuricea clavata]
MLSKTNRSYAEVAADVESSELNCPDCNSVFESLTQLTRYFLDAHVDQRPLMPDDVTASSREVDIADQESVDIDVVLSSTSETELPNTNPKAKQTESLDQNKKNNADCPKGQKAVKLRKGQQKLKQLPFDSTLYFWVSVLTSDSASSTSVDSTESSSKDDVLMHIAFQSSDKEK